jgi:hypothetical protein
LIRAQAAAREIAKLNKKPPPADEDDEAFECDDDGEGSPALDWAEVKKRFGKKSSEKKGGKS